jgi:metaxin
MPPKAPKVNNDEGHTSFSQRTRNLTALFSIPTPLKKLFDLVPVVVYPPNQLPQRAPKSSRVPSLYVFSTEQGAAAGRPSFNPSCLKWQVSTLKVALQSSDLTIW